MITEARRRSEVNNVQLRKSFVRRRRSSTGFPRFVDVVVGDDAVTTSSADVIVVVDVVIVVDATVVVFVKVG